jgi:hypothetical protein
VTLTEAVIAPDVQALIDAAVAEAERRVRHEGCDLLRQANEKYDRNLATLQAQTVTAGPPVDVPALLKEVERLRDRLGHADRRIAELEAVPHQRTIAALTAKLTMALSELYSTRQRLAIAKGESPL